jgi:beta-N-acetylhexosaminidase
MTLEEQAGQLLMGAVQVDQSPADVPGELGAVNTGAFLLLGNSTRGADDALDAVDRATAVAEGPEGVAPLVAVDQEGGRVQRLKGPGFDEIPAASDQASMPALRDSARAWGEQLRDAGINLNLAPVADVVPTDVGPANEPIGALDRGYGADPDAVSDSVAAFVQGMADGGVGAAIKHYPGLGKVVGNTDTTADVVDSSTTRDDPDLAPFHAGAQAGARFVMVSLATYTEIDPDRRAVFSPVVIEEMLRGDLDFDGVVISDDLGATAQVGDLTPQERALRFLRAGGDLMIVADRAALLDMADAIRTEAQDDPEFRTRVEQSVLRVLTVKQEMDLIQC